MAVDLIKYLRIRYTHLGRGFREGDCFNLGIQFYKEEFGITLPDFTDYTEDWSEQGKNYFVKMYKLWRFSKVTDAYKFGDVLFLTTKGKVSHVGIIVDPAEGYFIHTTKLGTAVHNYIAGEWASRVDSVIRHKDRIHAD